MDLDLTDYYGNPRRRHFQWRANSRAGREGDGSAGAFNGVCTVYEGDTFFMELAPCPAIQADGSTKIVMPRLPSWAEPIQEYEPLEAPKPLKSVSPLRAADLTAAVPTPAPLAPTPKADAPAPITPMPLKKGRGRWGPRKPTLAPVTPSVESQPVNAE